MSRQTRRSTLQSILAATGAGAAGLTFNGLLSGCTKQQGSHLHFYNWDTYIGDTTLADFRAASGIDVHMSLYANNDELFAKLRGGNQGYDVIVPSNDFVERLRDADMILPLDHSKIPNFRNVGSSFQDTPFDRHRAYSMPYTWLVLGLGYRKSAVDGVPDSWKWVFESDRYKGRIGLFGESADLFRLVFKYLGLPLNTKNPEHIVQAADLLIRQKPNILLFHDDDGQSLLAAGDIDIVIEYNGDIAQVMRDDADIDFVVPREGSEINSDCLCIPKGAHHPELAHQFINYLLDAKVGAGITSTIRYPTPNAAAAALMPEEYRFDKAIFPPSAILAKCDYSRYLGEEYAHQIEDAMTRVRAA